MSNKKKLYKRKKLKDYLPHGKESVRNDRINQQIKELQQNQTQPSAIISVETNTNINPNNRIISVGFSVEMVKNHLSIMFDAHNNIPDLMAFLAANAEIVDQKKCEETYKQSIDELKPIAIKRGLDMFMVDKDKFMRTLINYFYYTLFARTMAELFILDNPSKEELHQRAKEQGIGQLSPEIEYSELHDPHVERMAQMLIDNFAKEVKTLFNFNGKGRPNVFSNSEEFKVALDQTFKILIRSGKNIEEITQTDVATMLGIQHTRQLRKWLDQYNIDWNTYKLQCKEKPEDFNK